MNQLKGTIYLRDNAWYKMENVIKMGIATFVKDIKSLDDYYIYCEEYDILPKEPADFYKDFTNIPSELQFNRNRRK